MFNMLYLDDIVIVARGREIDSNLRMSKVRAIKDGLVGYGGFDHKRCIFVNPSRVLRVTDLLYFDDIGCTTNCDVLGRAVDEDSYLMVRQTNFWNIKWFGGRLNEDGKVVLTCIQNYKDEMGVPEQGRVFGVVRLKQKGIVNVNHILNAKIKKLIDEGMDDYYDCLRKGTLQERCRI
jgi:hypothetical protein